MTEQEIIALILADDKVRGAVLELLRAREAQGLEDLPLHHNLTFTLRDAEGNVKDVRQMHNVICTAGKNLLLASDGTSKYVKNFSYIAIGTGNTAEGAGNTALVAEVARANSTVTNPAATSIKFSYTFAAGTGTGAIVESGLLDAAAVGNMLARQTFSVINKGASDTLQVDWTIS